MILFNLIVSIFTDAYGDLKEIRVAVDIEQLNEVVMDVEYFVRILKLVGDICGNKEGIRKENRFFSKIFDLRL
jgi:hypothetical protein